MFKPVKKIALMCLLSIGFVLSQASFARAEINITPESAAEFARNHGGGEYADLLEKNDNDQEKETTVICGNKSTQCSSSQVCLKCSFKYQVTASDGYTSISYEEKGKCVSKSGFDRNNPRASWSAGDDCPEKNGSSRYGTISGLSLSVETSGFISAGWHDQFAYSYDTGHEFTDPQTGKKYRLYIRDGNPTVEYAESNEYKGCEVLPVKIYNLRGCFFCPLASLVLKAANEVTKESFGVFGAIFRVVIMVVFAIWLALAVLGQIFSMTKQDAPKFLAAVIKQGFKFMIAFFLLLYSSELFVNFVSPLLKGGLDMGMGIQTITPLSSAEIESLMADIPIKEVSISRDYFNIGKEETDTLYYNVKKYLVTLQNNLSVMQAIGTTIFCVGSHKITFLDIIDGEFIKGLRMMFLGGMLMAFAFLLGMSFAFYFIDALLQLAVIGAMMPMMIAGWPFKPTAQYAGTGFKMLLNTFFVMFFTGFVVSVDIELVNQSLSTSQQMSQQKKTDASFDVSREETTQGFNSVIEAANEQDWEKMNEATDIGGAGFLILTFCCIFGFKFVAQVTPLASKLSAGGFGKGGIAGKIATMAASSAKGMAVKAAKPIGEAVAEQYHEAGGVVGIVGDSAKTIGVVAGAIGGAAKDKGEELAAKGGFVGKVAGKSLSVVGGTVGGVGKAVGATGGAVSRVSKRIHQAYQRKEKR